MRKYLAVAACHASLLVGCAQHGKLSADKTGDLSHPTAVRASVDAALVDACGAPEVTSRGEEAMHRLPYLQGTDEVSTSIVWTSSGSEKVSVEVTTPGGERVATVDALPDDSADPGWGARQYVASLSKLEP